MDNSKELVIHCMGKYSSKLVKRPNIHINTQSNQGNKLSEMITSTQSSYTCGRLYILLIKLCSKIFFLCMDVDLADGEIVYYLFSIQI